MHQERKPAAAAASFAATLTRSASAVTASSAIATTIPAAVSFTTATAPGHKRRIWQASLRKLVRWRRQFVNDDPRPVRG